MSNNPRRKSNEELPIGEHTRMALRSSISHFAYSGSVSPTESPRRSLRLVSSIASESTTTSTTKLRSASTSPSKRRRSLASPSKASASSAVHSPQIFPLVDDKASPSKKLKRAYAAPEAYAHLRPLNDYLKVDLDVMFCGINPGCMSAETGHHFANPTNHFWRCLHRSGFTDQLLPPEEDMTLPDRYNLGLTNLVVRPSAEAAELSVAEMVDSVPEFLSKVQRLRPRFVCFVGKGIWQIVEKILSRMIVEPAVPDGAPPVPEPPAPSVSPSKRKKKTVQDNPYGIQRYQLVHPAGPEGDVRRTLFFMVPSTSGRVVSHQLSDKITLFTELKNCTNAVKDGTLAANNFATIKPGLTQAPSS